MRLYIDNILVMTKHNFVYRLKPLEKVLQKLAEDKLKVNTENPFFGCTENEYLSLWVGKDGARTVKSKVDTIKVVDAATNICGSYHVVGHIKYYRDMYHKHEHTLSPLPKLFSTRVKFKCTGKEKHKSV